MSKEQFCYECDSEFTVEQPEKNPYQSISFCPFCGSEMEDKEEIDDDAEEYFEEDDE